MDVVVVILIVVAVLVLLVLLIASIRIVRPTHRGLVERFGKYNRYANPGLHLIIPVVERMYQVDIR
jgi:regulator of protease activity HflC (stomatin/prohibitin superfamily)